MSWPIFRRASLEREKLPSRNVCFITLTSRIGVMTTISFCESSQHEVTCVTGSHRRQE